MFTHFGVGIPPLCKSILILRGRQMVLPCASHSWAHGLPATGIICHEHLNYYL